MRRRTLSAAVRTMLTAVVAVCAGAGLGPASAAAKPKSTTPSVLPGAVAVTRDSAGIPHIVAGNFKDLGLGEGYAFAQDNLCTFADDVVTLRGERSKYFGPNAVAVNYSAGTSATNLESDLYWRYVAATGIVQKQLGSKRGINALLPQARSLYEGWVAGYNRYLRSGQNRDPKCQGKPWVQPITMKDMILRGQQIVTEGSAQQFLSDIVDTAPPTAGAQAARATAGLATAHGTRGWGALKAQFGDSAARSQGSNGIGLGAQDTRSRHGMVLANPHFPWRGTERFWMAQLDVPGSYDMEGGTLMGFPMIGIGFNRNIAWTHTVSTSRRFAAYQLKLVPGDPFSYYVDGKPEKMTRTTVSVRYGNKTATHTFYRTRWGLVVDVTAVPFNAYAWTASQAYALYDAVGGIGPRAVNQYLRMGQATSVHQLYNVEAKYLAIPTFNTIAADDHGNAYYGDVGATPAVSQAEINTCLPGGIPSLVYNQARVITLDGSRSACAPANVAGTPERGIFSGASLPHTFRRDYVENSNDSYWLANPSHPFRAFSSIIGLTRTIQGLRTRLGNLMIQQRIAGTDGLGPKKFTISTLQRMWEGDRAYLGELVAGQLAADCRANPAQVASDGQTVELTAACNVIGSWNRSGRLKSPGGWLFNIWSALDTATDFYTTAFDPNKPLTTPAGLNLSPDPSTHKTPLTFLADAVLALKARGIPLNAGYGQVQHAPQSKRIAIGGCDVGCFNAIYSSVGPTSNPVDRASYGQVYDGSSLVMTTQLNPSGPESQGILTYSQASNPRSPWYSNMTKLYSQRKWVKLAYTPAQIASARRGAILVLNAK